MSTKTKIFSGVIALLLSAVLAFIAVTVIKTDNGPVAGSSSPTRTVEMNSSAVDAQSILNEFEDGVLTKDGTTTYFEGYKALDLNDFSEVDYISDIECEELENCKVKYNFSYNSDTNIVTLSATATLPDGTVETDNITGVGFINENKEIDAVMNVDGEGVLLSEMRQAGMIQNCGWFTNLFKKIVKAVVVAAVVVATAAVIVATAGVAAPAVVAVGVGVAGSTAVSVGSAAVGVVAGALFATTVGRAAVQAGVLLSEVAEEAIENSTNQSNDKNEKGIPDYPGNDPTQSPGEGWEWRGNGDPSSGQGSWYNPETGESLHPDLSHPEPIGSHWDYIGPDGSEYRILPDGSWTLK